MSWKEQEEKTVHWVTYTGQYSGLTLACGLWPMDPHTVTRNRKETTCGNCKRTRAYRKEQKSEV